MAGRFHVLAMVRPDQFDHFAYERQAGISHYFLGNLCEAQQHLQRAITCDGSYADPKRSALEHPTAARVFLARVLWLQGLPEQAQAEVAKSVAEAQASGRMVFLSVALMAAASITLRVGDLTSAENYIKALLDCSTKHAMPRWQNFGKCYQALLVGKNGQIDDAIRLLRAASVGRAGSSFFRLAHRLAEMLGRVGEPKEGLAIIEDVISQTSRREEHWSTADLLRVKGDLLLAADMPEAAEIHLKNALNVARQQGALSWELRAATSLARMWRDEGRAEEAHRILLPVYKKFTEGFATADLHAAQLLIDTKFETL